MPLKDVMDEQYFLVTQGKFSWEATEGMAIGERQYLVKKLAEEIKERNKQLKEAQDLARSKASSGRRG